MSLRLPPKKLFISIGIAIGICVVLLGGSVGNLIHNKREMYKLIRRQAQLDKQYEELKRQLELLQQQDRATLEDLARTQYNMAGANEIEFRFQTKK